MLARNCISRCGPQVWFLHYNKRELNHKSLHSNLCPLMFGWGTSRGTRALSDCRWRCLLLHATVVLHVGQGLWGDLNYINHDLLKGHIKTLNGHQLMSDWQLVLNLSVCYPILSTTTLFALCSFFFLEKAWLSASSTHCRRDQSVASARWDSRHKRLLPWGQGGRRDSDGIAPVAFNLAIKIRKYTIYIF